MVDVGLKQLTECILIACLLAVLIYRRETAVHLLVTSAKKPGRQAVDFVCNLINNQQTNVISKTKTEAGWR